MNKKTLSEFWKRCHELADGDMISKATIYDTLTGEGWDEVVIDQQLARAVQLRQFDDSVGHEMYWLESPKEYTPSEQFLGYLRGLVDKRGHTLARIAILAYEFGRLPFVAAEAHALFQNDACGHPSRSAITQMLRTFGIDKFLISEDATAYDDKRDFQFRFPEDTFEQIRQEMVATEAAASTKDAAGGTKQRKKRRRVKAPQGPEVPATVVAEAPTVESSTPAATPDSSETDVSACTEDELRDRIAAVEQEISDQKDLLEESDKRVRELEASLVAAKKARATVFTETSEAVASLKKKRALLQRTLDERVAARVDALAERIRMECSEEERSLLIERLAAANV